MGQGRPNNNKTTFAWIFRLQSVFSRGKGKLWGGPVDSSLGGHPQPWAVPTLFQVYHRDGPRGKQRALHATVSDSSGVHSSPHPPFQEEHTWGLSFSLEKRLRGPRGRERGWDLVGEPFLYPIPSDHPLLTPPLGIAISNVAMYPHIQWEHWLGNGSVL